jgi:molybdate transport system substrate-binding protein
VLFSAQKLPPFSPIIGVHGGAILCRFMGDTTMKRWLSGIAVVVFALATARAACAQEALLVTIVGRGDDGFKELIAQFEKNTGRKVAVRFPNFIESRDTIVRGEPFDVGIVEFPHDADVMASGNVVSSSATLIANGLMAVAVKKGAPKPDISTPSAVKRMLLNAKSIAYPDPEGGTGASGVNVVMMLRRLGIEDAVKAKTTLTRGGGRAMAMAASGEAEIGMTYHIGMYGNDKIDIVGTLPAQVAPPTPLIGFISSKSKNPAAARELLAFLTSPEARATYTKYLLEPAY